MSQSSIIDLGSEVATSNLMQRRSVIGTCLVAALLLGDAVEAVPAGVRIGGSANVSA